MLVITAGCGGAPSPEAAPTVRSSVTVHVSGPSVVRRGAIAREALDAVLDEGIPRFLGHVEVAGVLEQGAFVGFELVRFFPDDPRFSAVDLGPGDVVTRVNGTPIARPEHLFAVWEELRVASELVVEYKRGPETRELRFSIE